MTKPFASFLLAIWILSSVVSGCSSNLPIQPEPTQESGLSPTPTHLEPTLTLTISPTATPTSTATPEIIIYSPLENIPLSDLPAIISNPFIMPQPRMDDGHQGVDLAFYRYGDLVGIDGVPIHAVLPGFVAAIVNDRNPYGNMIMIETPLEWLPPEWSSLIPLPEIFPTVVTDGRLTCPENGPSPTYDNSSRSIYIVYGHMQSPPPFQVGDQIPGNQILGAVGNTGHSTNSHLHLETRIGPSHAQFTTIAHKDGAASNEEMYNYCVWRISSLFELFDPMTLIVLGLQ